MFVQVKLFACFVVRGLFGPARTSPTEIVCPLGLARGPWVLLFTIPLSEGVLALLQSEFLRLAACPCAVLLGVTFFSFDYQVYRYIMSCFGSLSRTTAVVTRHCCVSLLASALRGLLSWCGASVPLLALLPPEMCAHSGSVWGLRALLSCSSV